MNALALTGLHRQKGISRFGLLMLALLITGFFTVGLKVGPLYIDHQLLANLAEELVGTGQADTMTVAEVRERFANTLRVNNISGFELTDIRVARQEAGTAIRIAYERRVPLMANLEIIAVFDDTYQ